MEHEISQSAETLILGEYLEKEDAYYNALIADFFKGAMNYGRFSDLRIPLCIFDWATATFSDCQNNPLEVFKELMQIFSDKKLNDNQTAIVIAGILCYFKGGTFTDHHTGIPCDYSQVILLLDMELDRIAIARNAKKAKKYNWMDTMRKVDSLESFSEKISYLIARRTAFDQDYGSRPDGPNFGNNCDLEIKKLESQRELSKSHIDQCPPQRIAKKKAEFSERLISFNSPDTISTLYSALKGCFPDKEMELLKALQGEQLAERLVFPYNQNRLVEVFRRLKYNGYLLDTDTETRDWICSTFLFIKKGVSEPQQFNKNTVWSNLNKGKGEPPKKARICIADWLPYKSPLQLGREKESEKL